MSYSDPKVLEFYTINIPSMGMTMYSDPSKFNSVEEIESVTMIDISPNMSSSCVRLPRRFGGKIDINKLSKEKLSFSGSEYLAIMNEINQSTRKYGPMPLLGKPYSSKKCASPGCSVPISNGSDHLDLCSLHTQKLDEILEFIKNRLNLESLSSAKGVDPHLMAYQSLLPSIDKLLAQIKDKNKSAYATEVQEVLLIFKALIYIYRMHLNVHQIVLNLIISVMRYVLYQTRDDLLPVARNVFAWITQIFNLFGIALLFIGNHVLSDDRNWALFITGAGISGAAWGVTQILATGLATPFGPFAAVGLGLATIGIGGWMLFDRIRRGQPHRYAVHVNLLLNPDPPYLYQQLQ